MYVFVITKTFDYVDTYILFTILNDTMLCTSQQGLMVKNI